MNIEQIPDYYQSIRSLQEKYASQINIHLGMEVEYYPSQWDTIREYRKTLDYIILGQHISLLMKIVSMNLITATKLNATLNA